MYDEYKMPEDVNISLNENKFEVYENHNINDLILDSNVEILNKNKSLKNNSTGKNEITIEYKYKKRDYKYIVNYEIIDTKKPFIIRANTYRNTGLNEEIDLCEGLSYVDNYDRSPKCSISGDYDLSTPGIYNLKYEISDKSNNISIKDFTFEVIDYSTINYDYYEDDDDFEYTYFLFDDLEKNYKNKDTMLGIDVSEWQGEIDFNKVKEDGAEFVIIRMAVNPEDKKDLFIDDYYKQNIKNAKKAGLKVGVYVYTNASTKEEAINQAKIIKKKLNKESLDFPIAYDFENWNDFNDLHMNTHDLLSRVLEFKSILEEDGYDVMIYGSKYYLENVWLPSDLDIWLAHYTDNTDYSGKYKLWQIASDGIIDGIDGYVDLDIYYK